MVIVVATIRLKPATRDAFLVEFHRIVPAVRNEAGCIEYGPTVDATTNIANQNVDADRVTIVEKWQSVASLEAHLVAPHMLEYRPKVADYVVSSELRILEEA